MSVLERVCLCMCVLNINTPTAESSRSTTAVHFSHSDKESKDNGFRKERTRPGDKTDDMSVLLKAELIATHKYFTAFEARSALACICWLVAGGGGNITLYLFWDTLQGKCARECVCKSVCMGPPMLGL